MSSKTSTRRKAFRLKAQAEKRGVSTTRKMAKPGSKRQDATVTSKRTSSKATRGAAAPATVALAREQKADQLADKTPKTPKTPRSAEVVLKAEQRVTLPNGQMAEIGGIRAEATKYVWIGIDGHRAVMPYDTWHAGSGDGAKALREQGVTVVTSLPAVREAIASLKRFDPVAVAIRPGWTSQAFALASGIMVAPEGVANPIRAFAPYEGMTGRGGTLGGWKAGVAVPLAEHLIATFMMMIMFAAALLRLTNRTDNFGFELSGRAGCGKTTLQLLMASAAGPAVGAEGATYWRTCNATINALESVLEQYNDAVLILDEAGLVQAGGKVHGRALQMREMSFRLSSGLVRHRYGETIGVVNRLIYVLSTNRPIALLLGSAHAAETEATLDRMMTLPLDDRAHGIFDACPPAYQSTGVLAEALRRAAAEHYGHAVPAFIAWLVNRRNRNPDRFRRHIARGIAFFVSSCGVDTNDGSAKRVAEAYGLVYVAGKLATRAGVLPPEYRCLKAARAAFELHRQHGRYSMSFDDRLRRLMRDPGTIDTVVENVASMSSVKLAACRAFLASTKSGRRELWIPREHLDDVFTDWNRLRHHPEVEERLKRTEKDRYFSDRRIGNHGVPREVFRFDVTNLVD
jgi:hypothetical protein